MIRQEIAKLAKLNRHGELTLQGEDELCRMIRDGRATWADLVAVGGDLLAARIGKAIQRDEDLLDG